MTGRKDDNLKAPVYSGFLQYFPRAIKEVARVSQYGAEKYKLNMDDRNFARVEHGEMRYLDACARHMLDRIITGEINHEDGQLLHRAQIAWDGMAQLEIYLENKDKEKYEPGKAYGIELDAAGCWKMKENK